MGFFGKIKENFNHGGIKIQLQAPASVSMNDATVPVTVTVTATDQQRTIERVSVVITAQSRNQTFTDPNNTNTPRDYEHTVAQSEYAQPFVVLPGETKTVELSIVMNAGAALASQLPEGSGMAQVANVFQKLESVAEAMDGSSWQYYIDASAKVEGVTLSPSHRQDIQVLRPGEIGVAFQNNINL